MSLRTVAVCLFVVGALVLDVPEAFAATLRVSPDTGVYTAGATFSVRVVVNTQSQSINAAEGELSFNPADLSVVSVSKAGSIFNLWTREPEFSNATGKITFGGGSPSGYTGSAGTVLSVTFKTKHEGTSNVKYTVGSVLAADGRGTNVLSGMQGGSYTVQAATSLPQPEYVPPANTPGVPVVTSVTHSDQKKWYKENVATLSWELPAQIVAVRTLLDDRASSIPTKVYDTPIKELTLTDLPDGESYFHIQFKNADGWGRVAHYRLAVDATAPSRFVIEAREDNDSGNPVQKLHFATDDAASGVTRYLVSIDGGEKQEFRDEEKKGQYDTAPLAPGMHTLLVEAFDQAGNSIVATYDLVVTAFDKPTFTEYAAEIPANVIPVVRGTTRPNAKVSLTLSALGQAPRTYEVAANGEGVFTFIPEGRLSIGVYELSAVSYDAEGAQSDRSDTIRFAVQEPGMVRLFGMMVSVLSVVIPLGALVFALSVLIWFGVHRTRVLSRRLQKEVGEVEQSLAREMDVVLRAVEEHLVRHRAVRKGRVTREEQESLTTLEETVAAAEKRISKELGDVTKLLSRR